MSAIHIPLKIGSWRKGLAVAYICNLLYVLDNKGYKSIGKGAEKMFDGKTISERSSAITADLVRRVVVVVVGLVLVMSYAIVANAQEKMSTLKGEVIAVDNYAKTLTVKASETSEPYMTGKDHVFSFDTNEMTNVKMCTMNKSFRDIGVGEKVTLTYHEKDRKLIADAIDIDVPTLSFACYDQ